MATDHTRPTDETRAEEAKEAQKDHGAGAHGAGAAASGDADKAPDAVRPGVAAHEKDMAERGADAKGEGRI